MSPHPDDPVAPAEPARFAAAEGAVDWLRRELAGDGSGKILSTVGRGLGLLALVTAAVFALGIVAVVVTVVAFRDETVPLVVLLVLCIPALLAPLIARRSLIRLRASVTRPGEVGHQLRDLLSGVTDSPEIRELAGSFGRRGDDGPIVKVGRLRKTVRTAKLVTSVVGSAEPDPDRHQLLLPFTPERTTRMFASITWSLWGILLASIVIATGVVALLVSVVS